MTSGQTGSGFSVVIAHLRDHAATLNQVAAAMGQASDAAKQATIADTAFGQLPVASSFASVVRSVSTPGADVLAQAQTSVSSTGAAITATADNYEAVETGNTTGFSTISDDMGTYTPLRLGQYGSAVVSITPNGAAS